jgi:hypothetical protein
MVAQGATVAVLIASAGLSRIQFEDPVEQAQHDEHHSWEQMVRVLSALFLLRPRADDILSQIHTPTERAPPLGSVHPSHAHSK